MNLTPLPLTKEQAAYMAGIVDGEGCIYVNRRKPSGRRKTPGYGVKLSVSITNKDIVKWFKDNVYLTSIYSYQPKGNRKYKWMCTWNNSAAERLLLSIQPYLIIKKKHAELALPLLKRLRTSKIRGGIGKVVSKQEIAYRENIKAKISELNKRGRDE